MNLSQVDVSIVSSYRNNKTKMQYIGKTFELCCGNDRKGQRKSPKMRYQQSILGVNVLKALVALHAVLHGIESSRRNSWRAVSSAAEGIV